MTRLTAPWVVVAVSLSFVAASIAEKHRDWQNGKVLDSERSRYFAGTVGGGNTTGTIEDSGGYYGHSSSSQAAVYRIYETFVIQGDTYVYEAQEHIRWRWSKPASLTVNAPVRYAVEKHKLFVIDDDGKEHEMEITKKVLRAATPAASQH